MNFIIILGLASPLPRIQLILEIWLLLIGILYPVLYALLGDLERRLIIHLLIASIFFFYFFFVFSFFFQTITMLLKQTLVHDVHVVEIRTVNVDALLVHGLRGVPLFVLLVLRVREVVLLLLRWWSIVVDHDTLLEGRGGEYFDLKEVTI